MFKRLEIQHFKSIERAEINLGMVNIFVGNNGSGKSNIIDAVRFLKDAANNGLDRAVSDRHGIGSVRQWSPTRPYRVHIGIEYYVDQENGRYSLSIDSAKGQFCVASEEIFHEQWNCYTGQPDEEDEPETITVHERTNISRTKDGEVSIDRYHNAVSGDVSHEKLIEELAEIEIDHTERKTLRIEQSDELFFHTQRFFPSVHGVRRILTNVQAYVIYPNTLRVPQEPSNETFLSPEGRNFGSVFKRMRKTKAGADSINQITEAMKSILPNLEKISVLNVGGYLVPQFHMMEPDQKRHIFNVSQMSDGTLRILGLLTALYQQPRPSVIALEEPEQTVNPGILMVLADAIKEVSKKTQILVTTHSPNLLDHFDASQVRSVEMFRGKTIVGPISQLQMDIVRERLFSLGELLVTDGLHQ